MVDVKRNNIPLYLLCFLAFFCALGEGIKGIPYINVSRIFPVISVALILYSIISSRGIFKVYSKRFLIFIGLIVFHTILVYLIFVPEEFGYGVIRKIHTTSGYVLQMEAVSSGIIRFFLFAAVSVALIGIFVKGNKYISSFIIAINFGVLFSILLDGYQAIYSNLELRISGGFSNPNAFGYIGTTCFFLSLFYIYSEQKNELMKRICKLFIVMNFFVIIGSGSRGAYLALIIGISYLYLNEKSISKKFKLIGIVIGLLMLAFLLLPDDVIYTFSQRISIYRAIEDRGAHRLDIWKAYLSQWRSYLLWGVGFGRSTSVLTSTNIYNSSMVTHNTYLRILVEFGIINLAIFVSILINIYKKLNTNTRKSTYGFRYHVLNALLISFCIQSFFMNVLSQRITWIIIAVLISNAVSFSAKFRIEVEE